MSCYKKNLEFKEGVFSFNHYCKCEVLWDIATIFLSTPHLLTFDNNIVQ